MVFHSVCVQPGRMGRGYTQWQPLCHLRQVRHCTRYTHQCTPGSVVFILANEDTPDVSSVWICRKKALLFNNIVALVAAVLMVFSPMAKSFEMILLGRFLYGYNAGMCLFCLVCVYFIVRMSGQPVVLVFEPSLVPFYLASPSSVTLSYSRCLSLLSLSRSFSLSGLGWNIHLMYLGESSPKKLRGFLTITITIFNNLGKVMGQIVGIKSVPSML